MVKEIKLFNLPAKVDQIEGVDAIDNDFMLLQNPSSIGLDYPFKLDFAVASICTKGTMRGKVNLKPFTAQSPCFMIILPGQILEHEYRSDDWAGHTIIMSKRFIDSLDIKDRFSLFLSINAKPSIPLRGRALKAMTDYYSVMQSTVRIKDHPYRLDIVKHLTMAIFYGLGYQYYKLSEDTKKSKQDKLLERFLQEVHAHYREQRSAGFYADKLCLTPKYLSTRIKAASGKSANQWIDDHVMLEAKALLKSTNMTVQQVSDELNFPSQSFFGRYFKEHEGIPPREYRNK